MLKKENEDRLEICEKQILDTFNFKSDEHGCKADEYFVGITPRDWKEEPVIKLVSVLSPGNEAFFLRGLLNQYKDHEFFFAYGRTQLLFFMSQRELNVMTAVPQSNYNFYRHTSVLYQSLFDIELLEEVPWSYFHPKVRLRNPVVSVRSKVCFSQII